MRSIGIVMRKDLKLIFRDRTALIFLFGLPVIFALLFGMIYRGKGGTGALHLSVQVTDYDRSAESRTTVQNMQKAGITVHSLAPQPGIAKKVQHGNFHDVLIIPAGYGASIHAWAHNTLSSGASSSNAFSKPALTLLVDPAQTQLEGILTAMVNGAAMRTASTEKVRYLVKAFPASRSLISALTQQGKKTAPFVLNVNDKATGTRSVKPTPGDEQMPGLIIYFLFFMANSVALTLIEERKEGTLRRMLSSPLSSSSLLTGKLLARATVGILQLSLLILLGVFTMHMHITVAPFGMALIYLLCIYAATGMGLLIATLGRPQEQIQGMVTMLLLVMGLFSGCLLPRVLLPKFMRQVSYITPHAWALKAVDDLLLRRLNFTSALIPLCVLFLFGTVFYVLALARFRVD